MNGVAINYRISIVCSKKIALPQLDFRSSRSIDYLIKQRDERRLYERDVFDPLELTFPTCLIFMRLFSRFTNLQVA